MSGFILLFICVQMIRRSSEVFKFLTLLFLQTPNRKSKERRRRRSRQRRKRSGRLRRRRSCRNRRSESICGSGSFSRWEEKRAALLLQAEMTLLMDDEDAKRKHFNYDKIVEQQNLSKKKRKKMMRKGEELLEQDDFQVCMTSLQNDLKGFQLELLPCLKASLSLRLQVDVKDPRFQAMFTSHLFNLDPSHPAYRNTRATQSILSEKQRRRQQEGRGQEEEGRGRQEEEGRGQEEEGWVEQQEGRGQQEGRAQQGTTPHQGAETRMEPSLSLLVKSIKNKTAEFQSRKKQKLSKV